MNNEFLKDLLKIALENRRMPSFTYLPNEYRYPNIEDKDLIKARYSYIKAATVHLPYELLIEEIRTLVSQENYNIIKENYGYYPSDS